MTPTPEDISKWASDSFRDLTISEVVTDPKLQRWAWDFFNKPEDRLIGISLEIDGDGQEWEAKWLLLNPGKTPTRCFLRRINDDVQAFLPLARVTGADTYCGQYVGYKRWLKAKGFFSKINEPVAPEPPKTKPIPSADDKHHWLTNGFFVGEIRRKHGDKEILPEKGHLLRLGVHVPSLHENFQPYWIYLGKWPIDITEAIRPDVEESVGEPVDIQVQYRQGLQCRKPLLRWLVAKGFYTDYEADERERQETLEIVNKLDKKEPSNDRQ
jgi:hypothetical protein